MLPTETPEVTTVGYELMLVILNFFSYLLMGGSLVGLICACSGITWLCVKDKEPLKS